MLAVNMLQAFRAGARNVSVSVCCRRSYATLAAAKKERLKNENTFQLFSVTIFQLAVVGGRVRLASSLCACVRECATVCVCVLAFSKRK